MGSGILRRVVSYDGRMKYERMCDEEVMSSYQHRYVVNHYKEYFDGKAVLDAGCWTGPLEKALAEGQICSNVLGIDENEEALSVARKASPHAQYELCDLISPSASFLSAYRRHFETIVCLDVLEHLPKGQEARVLMGMSQVLKEGGVLILSTMASHILNVIDPAWVVGHRHYRVHALCEMLKEAGFYAEETLHIGNLYWDLDLLWFYIHKYVLNRRYRTSQWMMQRIERGFVPSRRATRIYILARKAVLSQGL